MITKIFKIARLVIIAGIIAFIVIKIRCKA